MTDRPPHSDYVEKTLKHLLEVSQDLIKEQTAIRADMTELTHRMATLGERSDALSKELGALADSVAQSVVFPIKPPGKDNIEDSEVPPDEAVSEPASTVVHLHPPASASHAEPARPESSLEMSIGTKWFSRLGIVALLIGLAMALNYSFAFFAPSLKILLGWILSGALFGVGENIRSKAPRLAPILQGGGLALGYLSLYAMFFIPSVQMFHSHPAGWVCLVLYVAAAIGISLKSNSQTLAVLSMGFGYYTASYSGMESIALASTGILVFTTLAIALYRPEWGILKKASVLGAFATAGYWSDPVRPGSPMRPTGLSLLEFYTWGVFLLFHGAALWPRHKADAALNILNTVAFFWVYAGVLDHPMLESGLVMVMIATVHFASLGQMVTAFRDEIPSRWAWSSLMLGILFTGLATLDYSHGKVEAAVLAAEAFLLGFLSRQSSYPRTFRWSALVFWMVSGSILFFQGFTAKTGMVLTGAWVAAIGLALDYFVFCPQHRFMSLITLVFSSFGLFYSLCIELPPQWLTIGFVSTAFAYMTLGFLAKRRKHRRTALLWLLMAGLNLLFHDIESLSTPYKIGLFILLGVGLLLASYGYSLMEKHLAEESTKN